MITYKKDPTDLALLEPAKLAADLRAEISDGMAQLTARYDETSSSSVAANGGWSAKQIVGHLIDSAGNNLQRVVRLSIDPELHMPGYQQVEWVAVQGYQDRPWPELLSLWQALNLHLAHAIERVQKEHLTRLWFHGEDRITLGFMLEDYIAHLRHHLQRLP